MLKIRRLRRAHHSCLPIVLKLSIVLAGSYLVTKGLFTVFRALDVWGPRSSANRPPKPDVTILFWTKWFDAKAPVDDFDVKRCLAPSCVVTTDMSRLGDADAIIFHSHDFNINNLPPKRTPRQLWIFLSLESPFSSGIEIPIWHNISAYPGGMFNLTATYRRDSDIYCPYGSVKKAHPADALASRDPFFENGIRDKANRILWFASNCETLSNREHFVDRLRQHYPIDTYGSCSADPSPESQVAGDVDPGTAKLLKEAKRYKHCHTRKNEMDCWRTLAQHYRYYLSLESNFCRDYITEKFYRPLYYGLLPIVAGGHGSEDYRAIAPKESFISAFDYQNPKLIAALLHKLDGNEKLFRSYFEWRKNHTVEFRHPLCICEVCQHLLKLKQRQEAANSGLGRIKQHFMTTDDEDGIDSDAASMIVSKSPGAFQHPAAHLSRWWHDGACVVP